MPRHSSSSPRPSRPIVISTAVVASLVALLMAAPADAATVPDTWAGGYANGGNTSTNPGEHVITGSTASKVTGAFHAMDSTPTPTAAMIVGGVAYHLVATTFTAFTASSVRTGRTLWTVPLPTTGLYFPGMAATGSRVLVSYNGAQNRAGGVLAVDISTRRVVWNRTLPAATLPGDSNNVAGAPFTDGTRVYIAGASNAINAYSVSSGAHQWSVPLALNSNGTIAGVSGPAAVGGVVYTSGQQGLIARDAATGSKRWSSKLATSGLPVVAGGRVLVTTGNGDGVQAYPAGGCGAATCAPTWTRLFDADVPSFLTVNAADASTAFLTWRTSRPGGAGACTSGFIGHVARLNAATGTVQWNIAVGATTSQLIRGGSTIWLYNDYVKSDCTMSSRILGYSTTATASTPAKQIPLTTVDGGFPQALSIGAGTLLQQTWIDGLIGYRVAGS